MEYTISQLAELAGVSTRTLRWYDVTGLLPPMRTADNGYRIYGPEQVDRLQLILFYRALGVDLKQIGAMLDDPTFDRITALHREWLTATMKNYSPAQHLGIVQLYVLDERFTAYYDKNCPGCAAFLTACVSYWAK